MHCAKNEAINDQGSFKSFTKAAPGDSTVFAWNGNMLSITTPSLVDPYFQQDEVAERYGIRNYSYADYYNQPPVEEEVGDGDGAGWVERDNGYDHGYVTRKSGGEGKSVEGREDN